MSVTYRRFHFLGLLHHACDFGFGWYAVAEVTVLVDFDEFSVQISRYAVAQFFHCVYPCSLKEFSKLTGYTFDAEEVGMVGPF